MVHDKKYSWTTELVAEILMFFISYLITCTVVILFLKSMSDMILRKRITTISYQGANVFLSLAYTLFLPLTSYLLSHAQQNNQEVRAQNILSWMVLVEIIRIRNNDNHSTWELQKSLEQLVRLSWVSFLVYSNAPLHWLRTSLFVVCVSFVSFEVLKGVAFTKAKDFCLIGKNPKLIHNYVKKIMLDGNISITPMDRCGYIVMGEKNHEITVCMTGYQLGQRLPDSAGMVTVSSIFEMNLTSAKRDTCLSFALAKMLRRRFSKLPVDEAGCKKALFFVVNGLIDHFRNNAVTQTDGNERNNPTEWVFSIIQEELNFVSDLLHIKVPIHFYFIWYALVEFVILLIALFNGIYLFIRGNPAQKILVAQDANNDFEIQRFSDLDESITLCLVCAFIYIQFSKGFWVLLTKRWSNLRYYNQTFTFPISSLENCIKMIFPKKKTRVYSSVFDLEAETSVVARLLKWFKRNSRRPPQPIVHRDAKEAILESLKSSSERLPNPTPFGNFDQKSLLTNRRTLLRTHEMGYLMDWPCQLNGSSTEAILVWHIATTLFHHKKPATYQEPAVQQNNNPHQEPAPQQNNNLFKDQEVALALSNYCHYLVKYLPELLPDEVEWTEDMYESVTKRILAIDQSPGQEPTKGSRCTYVLLASFNEWTVIEKGAWLAKELITNADNGKPVWLILAEFWAEMMLFIAPSDNVEGHEAILDREELITQLWALLTHAGVTKMETHRA